MNQYKVAIFGFDSEPHFLHELKKCLYNLGCEPAEERKGDEPYAIYPILGKGYKFFIYEANRLFPLGSDDLKFLEAVRKVDTQFPIIVICPPGMGDYCKQDIIQRLSLKKIKRNNDRGGWEFSDLEYIVTEALIID
ncbi:MAG: hypothetical protein WC575_02670 [Patescibacteria group bacterium]